MGNSLSVKIHTGAPITAPALARLLMSLNALHVAALLTSTERGALVREVVGHTGVIKTVRQDDAADVTLLQSLAAINSSGVDLVSQPVRITEVKMGSIEVVIEEIIESI